MSVYVHLKCYQITYITYNVFVNYKINQEYFSQPQERFNEIILDVCIAFYHVNIHHFFSCYK